MDCSYCGVEIVDETEAVGEYHGLCWLEDVLDAEARINVLTHDSFFRSSSLATRAESSDSPMAYLWDVMADPGHGLEDRLEASFLLDLDTGDAVEAAIRCSDCLEGEAFDMDETTGEVRCANCGAGMERPERFRR